MAFWYQVGIQLPQIKKKEEYQSKMFPWLDDEQSKRLVETVDKMETVNFSDKLQKQQDIYRDVLPQVKAKEAQIKKTILKNETFNDIQDIKDKQQKSVKTMALKMEDLADIIKTKYNLDKTAPTEWIIESYNNMLNDQWVDPKLVEDYMNGKSYELLYVSWLKDRPEDMRSGVEKVATNVAGGAYDSATWLPRFVAENLAKGVGWIAEKLWADEAKVQWLVDSYVESLKDFSWEAMWADTESWVYKATKMVWDIAQIANPSWLWKLGVKAGQIAGKIAKEWSLIGKVAKWATQWVVDTAVFMPQSEQRMATPWEIAIWATIGWAIPAVVAWAKAIKQAPEIVARALTKTNTAQEKLFKAQNPTLNVLNKNRNFKTIRAESDLANDLIVKSWHKPIDTETRRIAHEATMKSKWAEVESKVKDRKTLYIDQRQFAKILEDTVADVKKSWLVKNTADIKALEAEAQAMRKQQFIDLPSLEKKKQYINGIVNNWGDSAIGDVYKNGMKKVTRAIWEVEDSTLAKIPWEFSNLKKEFGALKATYEDILKSDLKAQKAKGMDIMESYSRIEWIWDILWGTLSMFTRGTEWLKDVVKWSWKIFMWKVLKKMKDADFLIKEWFESLSSK